MIAHIVRLGLCFMFVYVHGGPQMFGGQQKWMEVGSRQKVPGISSMPRFLRFIAAVYEFLGGFLLGLELFTRMGDSVFLANLVIAANVMLAMKALFAATSAIKEVLFMMVLMVGGQENIAWIQMVQTDLLMCSKQQSGN